MAFQESGVSSSQASINSVSSGDDTADTLPLPGPQSLPASIQPALDEFVEKINDLKTVAAAWLEKLPDNRYTGSFRIQVEDWLRDATLWESKLDYTSDPSMLFRADALEVLKTELQSLQRQWHELRIQTLCPCYHGTVIHPLCPCVDHESETCSSEEKEPTAKRQKQ